MSIVIGTHEITDSRHAKPSFWEIRFQYWQYVYSHDFGQSQSKVFAHNHTVAVRNERFYHIGVVLSQVKLIGSSRMIVVPTL